MSKLFTVEARVPQAAADLLGTSRWAKVFIAASSLATAQLALSTSGVFYRAKEMREVPTEMFRRLPSGWSVKNPRGVYVTAARQWATPPMTLHFAGGSWSRVVADLAF